MFACTVGVPAEKVVPVSAQPPAVPPPTVKVIESVEDILAFVIAFAAISAVSILPAAILADVIAFASIDAVTTEPDFISAVSTAFAAICAEPIDFDFISATSTAFAAILADVIALAPI